MARTQYHMGWRLLFFYTVLHRKSYFEALSIRKVLRMLLTIGQGFSNSAFKGPNLNFHQCQIELGGMTKNLYHGIFLNYTGFTVYDGIYFFHA